MMEMRIPLWKSLNPYSIPTSNIVTSFEHIGSGSNSHDKCNSFTLSFYCSNVKRAKNNVTK